MTTLALCYGSALPLAQGHISIASEVPRVPLPACSHMMTAASHSGNSRLKHVVPIESEGGGGPVVFFWLE